MLGRQRAGGTAGGSAAGGQPIDLIDWDGILACVCSNLHWGWHQAEEELDLHRLHAFTREWKSHPPAHYLVAAYLGYESPDAPAKGTSEDLQSILAAQPVHPNAPGVDSAAWDLFATAIPELTHHG